MHGGFSAEKDRTNENMCKYTYGTLWDNLNSPSFIAMFKTEKVSNVRTLVANRQGIIDIPRTSKYFSQKLFKLNYFTLQS